VPGAFLLSRQVRKKFSASTASADGVSRSKGGSAKILVAGSIFRMYSAAIQTANRPMAMKVTVRLCLRLKNTQETTM
jgi:hypothetical protein